MFCKKFKYSPNSGTIGNKLGNSTVLNLSKQNEFEPL